MTGSRRATTDPRAGLGAQRRGAQPGVRAVAAPVLDTVGSAVAAVAVQGPAMRLPDDLLASVAHAIVASETVPVPRGAFTCPGADRWQCVAVGPQCREQSGGRRSPPAGIAVAPEEARRRRQPTLTGGTPPPPPLAVPGSLDRRQRRRSAAYRVAPMRRRGSGIVAATVLLAALALVACSSGSGAAPGMPADPMAPPMPARPPTAIRAPCSADGRSADLQVRGRGACLPPGAARRLRRHDRVPAGVQLPRLRAGARKARTPTPRWPRRARLAATSWSRPMRWASPSDWNYFGNPPGPTTSGSSTPSWST